MSHDSNLVYMANQIGKFFARQPTDKAVDSIADHLFKYWDPRMRKAIVAHLDEHAGAGLDPRALAAVQKVRDRDRQKQLAAVRR
ncbi:MAG: formate dehydrogenase subunit delta [Alphaproteobacteria bacterium]|nr:formate dehydrogenase subunit delta [Alphaproteobacteria bacterium]MDE1968193.1 formate dehydrogenase subunit delta [Alphaproteobacteria bacterium]